VSAVETSLTLMVTALAMFETSEIGSVSAGQTGLQLRATYPLTVQSQGFPGQNGLDSR
jgi:hypothetical protein